MDRMNFEYRIQPYIPEKQGKLTENNGTIVT